MLIEVMTFRLLASADVEEFLAADAALQTELMLRAPGLVRRTTARNDAGEWLVIVLWDSADAANAAAAVAAGSTFEELVDRSSVETRRYTTLD